MHTSKIIKQKGPLRRASASPSPKIPAVMRKESDSDLEVDEESVFPSTPIVSGKKSSGLPPKPPKVAGNTSSRGSSAVVPKVVTANTTYYSRSIVPIIDVLDASNDEVSEDATPMITRGAKAALKVQTEVPTQLDLIEETNEDYDDGDMDEDCDYEEEEDYDEMDITDEVPAGLTYKSEFTSLPVGSVASDIRNMYLLHASGIKKRKGESCLFENLRALVLLLAFDEIVQEDSNRQGTVNACMFVQVYGQLEMMPLQEEYQKSIFRYFLPSYDGEFDPNANYCWPHGFLDYCYRSSDLFPFSF